MLNTTIIILEYREQGSNGLLTVIPPYGVTDGNENDPDALHLGFIPQYHYTSLQKVHDPVNISSEESDTEEVPNEEALEAKKAFEEACELRGLPYDTCLHNETEEANQTFSLAPGEGMKPIPSPTDNLFEELSNPEKFPKGKGGFADINKSTKLTLKK